MFMEASSIYCTLESLKGSKMHKGKVTFIFVSCSSAVSYPSAYRPILCSTISAVFEHRTMQLGSREQISFPFTYRELSLEDSTKTTLYQSWVLHWTHQLLNHEPFLFTHPISLSLFLQCTWLISKGNTKKNTLWGWNIHRSGHPKTKNRPEHPLLLPSIHSPSIFQRRKRASITQNHFHKPIFSKVSPLHSKCFVKSDTGVDVSGCLSANAVWVVRNSPMAAKGVVWKPLQ